MVKYVSIFLAALSIAACSEGVPIVAEPEDTNSPWGPVESTQSPLSADDLITFKYEDQGVATLEDGLYVLEERLAEFLYYKKT